MVGLSHGIVAKCEVYSPSDRSKRGDFYISENVEFTGSSGDLVITVGDNDSARSLVVELFRNGCLYRRSWSNGLAQFLCESAEDDVWRVAVSPQAPVPAAKLNWQPMETAPADGTWVLLYFPADENRERPAICAAAQYDAGYGEAIGAPPIEAWRGPYSDGFDTRVSDLGVFTHWAPMPDGPR